MLKPRPKPMRRTDNCSTVDQEANMSPATLNQSNSSISALSPVPYSSDSLRWDLKRVREAWHESRRRHDRYSIYQYLEAVFELVMVWETENAAVSRAARALRMKGLKGLVTAGPFSAVIACTSSLKRVDAKARSKWARVLMFAKAY